MPLVTLAHEEHGPKTGPALLLLHGFPLDRRMWLPTAKVLAQKGYRVILPDLRGHGKSPVAGGATMQAMADDVAALLDSLTIRKATVVGFSMGGYVALQLAVNHRSRLDGIVLVDTRAEADTADAAAGRAKTIEAVRANGMQPLLDGMLPKLTHAKTATRRPEALKLLETMMRECPPEGAIAALEGMRVRPDMRGKLAAINLPCLVVVGEDDQVTPPESASRMAQAFRGSDYELIPDAGHAAPLEDPDRFHRVLTSWLGQFVPVKS